MSTDPQARRPLGDLQGRSVKWAVDVWIRCFPCCYPQDLKLGREGYDEYHELLEHLNEGQSDDRDN